MFEFSFVKKYLTPKKKQLSVSLIGVMSMAVISLVVWLVVVFLSVTEGIEKNWLHKLTTLNAPIQIKPTQHYFSSYYYNIDCHSESSHYLAKTIGQKARALLTDPFNPETDAEIPRQLAKPHRDTRGKISDPVKDLFAILSEMKKNQPKLVFQDVELGGAMLRLNLLRPDPYSFYAGEIESQLTHISYLASYTDQNPSMDELILQPNEEDLNHLLYLAGRNQEQIQEKFNNLLQDIKITKLKTRSDLWRLPYLLLPEKKEFFVDPYFYEGQLSHLTISDKPTQTSYKIERRGSHLFFKAPEKPEIPVGSELAIFSTQHLEFNAKLIKKEIPNCKKLEDLPFKVTGRLQNKKLIGQVNFEGLEIASAEFSKSPLLIPREKNETGITLAKNFKQNGVKLGDRGFLSYPAPTPTGTQEMRVPVFVSSFYDPGVMAVGLKSILVPKHITEAVNLSNSAFSIDKSEANKVLVWFPNLKDTEKVHTSLQKALREKGIDKYWKIETYQNYPFAKDLLQQFQSDKYLFSLVGIIILFVACTNIISLLVLLVSDKKKEIGILSAMGAKKRSITAIFAICGTSLGLFSCLIGISLALLTLSNIDSIVHFLSALQGHDAFNAQFFGSSLPNKISTRALWFAAFATPLISLLAGVFPAIKASRMSPSETLRSH